MKLAVPLPEETWPRVSYRSARKICSSNTSHSNTPTDCVRLNLVTDGNGNQWRSSKMTRNKSYNLIWWTVFVEIYRESFSSGIHALGPTNWATKQLNRTQICKYKLRSLNSSARKKQFWESEWNFRVQIYESHSKWRQTKRSAKILTNISDT